MDTVISNDLVLDYVSLDGKAPLDPTLKLAHIGYESIVTSDNMWGSSQAAGFPVSNLANPLTAHRWKPTSLPATVGINNGVAVDAQYMGIASHSLSENECIISFQYSTNGGSSWQTTHSVAPPNNQPIMSIFSVQAMLWRIKIERQQGSTLTTFPSIGILQVGPALIMQRGLYQGHTPITFGRKTKRITNKTEGGQYAGNSVIREGVATTFEWTNLTAEWVRTYFSPFIVSARSRPFFIAWRYAEYPLEVGFVWTDSDIQPTNSGPRDFMSVTMSVNGYSDE